ncbi:MAG: 16S rRNA (guanine(527)-N(7))-methyltransferase RsmG [Anaerolineales bacterium]
MSTYVGLQDAARGLLRIDLSPEQMAAFERYAAELISWNQRINLTAITDPVNIEIKHFLDSMTCILVMGAPRYERVVDVGSGAGFPGLPLKILRPKMKLTLVESIGKKVEFCRHVIERLGLNGVELLHDRAENIGHADEHRQKYDWAVARAVASMPVLVEYLLPLLRVGGKAVIQKGETGPVEAHAAEEALRILGGRLKQIIPLELPRVVETRYLIVVEKSAATPPRYPRRVGIPAKRPLA